MIYYGLNNTPNIQSKLSCNFMWIFLSEKNSIWIEPTILLQTYC